MKINVSEKTNFVHNNLSKEEKQMDETIDSCQFTTPWISRVFDTIGLISIATVIVVFFYSFTNLENNWQPFLFISLLFSGFIYVAVAVILRAVCESAFNTKKLLMIKQIEHYK
jgi:hypothetical protein